MKAATKKQKIELVYNGFHGRNSFTVLAVVEKVNVDPYKPYTQVTITKSAAQRINRVVGCKTHKVVFGVSHPIPGACGCGEGLVDITCYDYADLDDITFYTTDDFEYRGRYPQN